jgi:hypothetical protein
MGYRVINFLLYQLLVGPTRSTYHVFYVPMQFGLLSRCVRLFLSPRCLEKQQAGRASQRTRTLATATTCCSFLCTSRAYEHTHPFSSVYVGIVRIIIIILLFYYGTMLGVAKHSTLLYARYTARQHL